VGDLGGKIEQEDSGEGEKRYFIAYYAVKGKREVNWSRSSSKIYN